MNNIFLLNIKINMESRLCLAKKLISKKSMQKKNNKVLTIILSIIIMLGVAKSTDVFAATDPGLGAAATFSIIAQTGITGTATISGDVGLNSTGAGITALTAGDVGGTIYSTDGVAPGSSILDAAVQANLSTANGNISGQGSTASIGPALDGLTVTPGVYDIGAGRLNGGVLTLDGSGVYIFRASSDLVSSGSLNLINGARACDVFWQVDTLATINGSSFTGTIIAGTGVHFGNNVTLDGSALALGGDVTLLNNTISGPSCAAASTPVTGGSSGPQIGTINVVKVVVNDNSGTKKISDFPLFVNDELVTSGWTNTYEARNTMYAITETEDPNYTSEFSGDCDANGEIELVSGNNFICVVTNDDIGAPLPTPPVPPLIDIVKVPSPLALPAGPGPVTYTYTLSNIGTVPVSDVTLAGDSCSPINLISGDTNNDSILDLNEKWVYTCSTTLSETHTNTIVATGWVNGISATDVASAKVVVGVPDVPPLIHVTKIPNKFTLPSGGGLIDYIVRVTNPGTVALSDVKVTDNKCAPMTYFSGDTNGDSLLDTTETWRYTCQLNLTKTTVNTVMATGFGNGSLVRDLAIATVVVSPLVPSLPNTGFVNNIPWTIIIVSIIMLVISTSFVVVLKKRLN